jgi:hypothetical protein
VAHGEIRRRTDSSAGAVTELVDDVRLHIFQTAAATARIPQAAEIAQALDKSEANVIAAMKQLAEARIIVLAPNTTNIWIAAPFCAVPSRFRVETNGQHYFGICVWDALGIISIIGTKQGTVRASCGDCGDPIKLDVDGGRLTHSDGIVHFGVPARDWWDNIGFT